MHWGSTNINIQRSGVHDDGSRFVQPVSSWPCLIARSVKTWSNTTLSSTIFTASRHRRIRRSGVPSQEGPFHRGDVVLYDLTTLRFESTKKRAHSSATEMRSAVRTDPAGFEVEYFEGKTLKNREKMRKKFTVKRFVFCDQGLFSWGNLEHLEDGGEFIVGMKMGTLAKPEQRIWTTCPSSSSSTRRSVHETTVRKATWSKSRASVTGRGSLDKMRASSLGSRLFLPPATRNTSSSIARKKRPHPPDGSH